MWKHVLRVIPISLIVLLAVLVSHAGSFSLDGGDLPARLARALEAAPNGKGAEAPGVDLSSLIVEFDGDQTATLIAGMGGDFTIRKGTGIEAVDEILGRNGFDSMRPVFMGLYRKSEGQPTTKDERAGFYLLKLGPFADVKGALEVVHALQNVAKSAQLNYVYQPDLVPDDTRYAEQWSHQVTSAEQGWDFVQGDANVAVAIIGTGVEPTHSDLYKNLWVNQAEIPGNSVDDDQNGFVDDQLGWDFFAEDNDPSPDPATPEWEHETSVAGVAAAATDNENGIAGVCWSCSLMNLRVSYTTDSVAQAIDYATENGAAVINMSFGSYDPTKYGPDTVVETAVNKAYKHGVTVVATAGNDGISTKRYPGALENVIGVASTLQNDARAGFSNFGSWVDVAAPGYQILSTYPGDTYQFVNGTSFSAPYVAGLAGLLRSKDPSLSPLDTRLRIEYTADKLQPDHFIGSGRVNVFRAVKADENPRLFAVIKSPLSNTVFNKEPIVIEGTALCGYYVLETKPHGSSTWTPFAWGGQTINGVLGELDPEPLANGLHDIRLDAIVDWPGSEDMDQITILVDHQMKPGWPVHVDGGIGSSPVYADLDGDGSKEIVVASFNALVYAWHSDGTSVDGFPANAGTLLTGSPAVGDLDGDGSPEIVVASWTSGYVFAWHHDGTILPNWPQSTEISGPGFPNGVFSAPVLADLDGDGKLDVLVGVRSSGSVGKVYAWKWTGANVPSAWPKTVGINLQSSPAIGQLDADPQPEVVVHGYENVYVLNHDGTTAWSQAFHGDHTSPVIGDVDGNGTNEIVVAGDTSVRVYRGDGTIVFTTPLPAPVLTAYSSLSLGDVDDDGKLEIFIGVNDGRVFGVDDNGAMLPGWPKATGGDVMAACAVGNLDADPAKELLTTSYDGMVYAWNVDGTPVTGFPRSGGGPLDATPAIGDIDNDGKLDVMFGSEAGDFYALTFATPWDSVKAQWPMCQHDARHSGRLGP